MQIRFDQGPAGADTEFREPGGLILARDAAEVPAALDAMERARAGGNWLAGYATYELGYALESRLAGLMPEGRQLPLLCFGVYERPEMGMPLAGPAALSEPCPRWKRRDYGIAFDRVHALIGAGDIYQANLTFPMAAKAEGGAEALYAALRARQSVGHGVLVRQTGLPDLLSRSPELFFRTDAGGTIETRPMKGTQPRSADPEEDAAQRSFLAADPKNRAENLMIVDLLRNDISRVAAPGSVEVPDLFEVETYTTVHQMVSRVRARLAAGATLGDIFRALFPCGSITGAPKLRAMEVIRELEPSARGIYCGTIGWAAPDGRSEFNVAIRTLTHEDGHVMLNVGGGVVWDSTAKSEYEEALWKARFAAAFRTEHA
ncbi:aminodeoxychorismate synthase, subunit I [Salinihabitans flavidus]|uniref:Aminodeoxychorismate synthase, subunit I n=1 Tax=Salinihabitans flavidus TaxID=569882 RepID=A0A1H8QRR5_9RHOB|nr:aminodeoxychorismate synthase component I [Salinihabitans flavidus]SEO56950.1 aminodeoxychorismate synthase, subunit I [Salinihabitans flavidus]